jgi:hypothetical protein
MEAQGADVEEAQLVGAGEVEAEELDEAVLRYSDAVLDLETTSAGFRLLGEFVV